MPTKYVAKNVLLALLTLCLVTFTASAQRGGGHGGGGGGHAGGGGGGHVSTGGGGHVASAAPSVRSGGYSTQGYRGSAVARGGVRPVVVPRSYYGYNNAYRGYGRYGYGLGYYGGYYPGYYYGCPYDPSCYAPSVSYEYPQPTAVDPGPDYSQQYAAPPPPQGYYAPRPQPPTPTVLTLLAFKDHSIQVAMAYSFDRGSVVYVNETGVRKTVPADQLDFDTTRKLNTDRGVTFDPH
jgi:hypothetical protein